MGRRWEYKTVVVDQSSGDVAALLNVHGEDGWRLVQTLPVEFGAVAAPGAQLVLEREVSDDSTVEVVDVLRSLDDYAERMRGDAQRVLASLDAIDANTRGRH